MRDFCILKKLHLPIAQVQYAFILQKTDNQLLMIGDLDGA